jgi:hypothetical protein
MSARPVYSVVGSVMSQQMAPTELAGAFTPWLSSPAAHAEMNTAASAACSSLRRWWW